MKKSEPKFPFLFILLFSFVIAFILYYSFLFSQKYFNSSRPLPTPVVSEIVSQSKTQPSPTTTEIIKEKETAVVKRVVDGDTIELSDGRKVRYIGIDTPESVDPRRSVQCFGLEATDMNKELVQGKKST